MSERSIKVILKANVADFKSQISSAGTSLDELAKKGDKTGKASETTMGRLAQSAQMQRESWTTAGTSLLAVGTAITGVNVLVAKTGIEYNTLQQKSKAALSTILGSTEAANEQLAKFDEFARTSPFGKDIFLKAQQQMLGFGIEAEKVIPYLGAINEAVAATGGSGQDIAELTRIFSQVQAAAKITAVDLMQFGQRGIDAASLIGSRMGKTGAEIREEITAGTLDAGTALDALADGMQEKFAGASAGVKETMAGAFDRVKAAFRDLSAAFLSSAVDPDGGGWLVNATNSAADFLRMVEKLPQPVKDFTGALSGVAGVAALAAGGLLLVVPRLFETITAFQALKTANPGLASGLGKVAKGAGIAAAAFVGLQIIGAIGDKFATHAKDFDTVSDSLTKLAHTAEDVKLDAINDIFRDAKDPARDLAGGVGDLAGAFDQLNAREDYWQKGSAFAYDMENALAAILPMQSQTEKTDEALANLDRTLSTMDPEQAAGYFQLIAQEAEKSNRTTEQWLETFSTSSGKIRDDLLALESSNVGWAASSENVAAILQGKLPQGMVMTADGAKSVADALAAGQVSLDEFGNVAEEVKTKAVQFSDGIREVAEETAAWIESTGAASGAFVDTMGAWDDVIAKNKEVAEAAAEASSSAEDSWEDFFDGQSVAIGDYLAELESQLAAQANWQANMVELASKASQGVVDSFVEMGENGAPALQALLDGTTEDMERYEAVIGRTGAANNDFGQSLLDAGAGLYEMSTAATESSTSLANAGAAAADINGRVAGMRDTFLTNAIAMGYTAGEASLLADAYGLIPGQVVTTVGVDGVTLSMSEVQSLNEQLEGIPPEKRAEIVTIAHTEGAEKAQQAIDEVKDKDVDLSSTYHPEGEQNAKSGLASVEDRHVTISADASSAIAEANRARNTINSMTASITIRATRVGGGFGIDIPAATGGNIGDIAAAHGLAGGGMASRHPAGLVTGPGSPTSDSVNTRLSRREFVTNALATDYYGHDLMYAMNARRIPREHFAAMGFADGGTPSRTYQSSRSFAGPTAPQVAGATTHEYRFGPGAFDNAFPGVKTAAEIERVLTNLPQYAQMNGAPLNG